MDHVLILSAGRAMMGNKMVTRLTWTVGEKFVQKDVKISMYV